MNDLGLVETVDRFGESIVIAVTDAPNRRLDTCFSQALGIPDRHILNAPVRVMDKAAAVNGASVMKGLLKASRTNPACAVRLTRQPTIRRAKASMMKAT
jgi:hypothetical protein